MTDPSDPTYKRALACHGKRAEDLTGVELLALFEVKAVDVRDRARPRAPQSRAAALAITYGQEARQRYTEAIAHERGTHNPVDIEALIREGQTESQERERFAGDTKVGPVAAGEEFPPLATEYLSAHREPLTETTLTRALLDSGSLINAKIAVSTTRLELIAARILHSPESALHDASAIEYDPSLEPDVWELRGTRA